MEKDALLKYIAKTGYNVGFGAKTHFATYDMIEKIPGLISIISIGVGIFALINDFLAKDFISATFIVLGIIGLYVSFWDARKSEYSKAGVALTQLCNELEKLYRKTNSMEDSSIGFAGIETEVRSIESTFYGTAISKQMSFSGWFAHYKFFWEHQIDWIDEQLHFKFLRDKVPLSLTLCVAIFLVTGAATINWKYSSLIQYLCP